MYIMCPRSAAVFKSWNTSNQFDKTYRPVPELSGVYVIFMFNYGSRRMRLIYIGSSKNLKKRISTHPILSKKVFNTKLYFMVCQDYFGIEKHLIKKHKPILNRTYNAKKIH